MVDKAIIAGSKKDKSEEKLALSKGLHYLFIHQKKGWKQNQPIIVFVISILVYKTEILN